MKKQFPDKWVVTEELDFCSYYESIMCILCAVMSEQ